MNLFDQLRRSLESRPPRPALQRVAIVVVVGIVAYYAIRVGRQGLQGPGGDFGVYYRAGAAFAARAPLYTLDQGPLLTFKNPPVVALALAPLAQLHPVAARLAWFALDVAGLVLIGVALLKLQPASRAASWALVLGAMALAARYIFNQWHAGSTATLWIAQTVWACVALRQGRPRLSGALLASAVAWKLVPLCFVPLLVIDRRRGAACVSFGVCLLALALLPSLWLGWDANLALLGEWPQHLARTETPEQLWRIQNQSVAALLTRLFTETPYGVHVATLSAATVRHIWLALAIVSAAVLYGWIFVVRRKHGTLRTDAAVVGVLLLYMTLFNPLAWRYNFVAVVVPYGVVLHAVASKHPRRAWLVGLLAVSFILSVLPAESTGLPGMLVLRTVGARLWGTALLGLATILSLMPEKSRHAEPYAIVGPFAMRVGPSAHVRQMATEPVSPSAVETPLPAT